MIDSGKYNYSFFEHESARSGKEIPPDLLMLLQQFYGSMGIPYFSLIHNGVRFCEYVGVLQVGRYTIEVLPKADKSIRNAREEKGIWQRVLIDMLRAVGEFNVHAPSNAALKLKCNSVLDLYFEQFVTGTEYLMHQGLVKKYRKAEANKASLKGKLDFSKHLRYNLVHRERFFVNYMTYDTQHVLNSLLYQTLTVIQGVNRNPALNSRISSLLLDFPQMTRIRVIEETFQKITYNRKTESYRKLITISRLILLNYHPDLVRGQNNVLALMFDMNSLWEKYIYKMLLRVKESEWRISFQNSKKFWEQRRIRPDIVLTRGSGEREECFVIDTKWKLVDANGPSDDDLKQVYAYNMYWGSTRSLLLYPGKSNEGGRFGNFHIGRTGVNQCKTTFVEVLDAEGRLDKQIGEKILGELK